MGGAIFSNRKQGLCSDASTHLPPLWPGFDPGLGITCWLSLLLVLVIIINFLGQVHPRGKGAMRLTLYEAPIRETRPNHNTGSSIHSILAPRVFLQVLWFSSLHKNRHSKFQFDLESVDEEPLCGCDTAKFCLFFIF